ncbi:hypothetical protein [Bacillus cereus]|uniref:hypothetical protein n=1 Tax=Bacillus cereus TaxID=1396 RepID=UPI00032EA16A|nr:hypothetical protein [Bacillus cereus]EOO44420.1 hypothetical protein ICK_06195 [Bacillus cereus BAG1X2-2]
MQSKLAQLKEKIAEAKQIGAKFIYIIVKNPELTENEIIINPIVNADSKIKYFEKAYDENLCLKNKNEIEIVDFGYSHEISDEVL